MYDRDSWHKERAHTAHNQEKKKKNSVWDFGISTERSRIRRSCANLVSIYLMGLTSKRARGRMEMAKWWDG